MGAIMKDKIKKVLLACTIVVVVLMIVLTIWGFSRKYSNSYDELFAHLDLSSVESVSLVVGRPAKDVEMSESQMTELLALLTRIRLGAKDDTAWNTLCGGPCYYPFRIKLTDGTDFILAVSELYFTIWPDPEAYYYPSVPREMETPLGYGIDISSDRVYQDILTLSENLYEQY